MSKLGIYLFGPPHLELDDKWVNLKTHRGIGFIAYLTVNQESHTRETLASMLWPKSNQSSASAALRTTLWRIKKSGLQKWFLIDRYSIKINLSMDVFVDVNYFHELLLQSNNHGHPPTLPCNECITLLEKAISIYRSGFMHGYFIYDSREYEEWQSFQHERLQFEYLESIERLVKGYRSIGNIDKALKYANSWLSIDPYNDEAHRIVMQLYTEAGQRESALSQYNEYVRILKQDLNISPDEATVELFKQIKNGTHLKNITKHKQDIIILFYLDYSSIYSNQNIDEDDNLAELTRYRDYLTAIIRSHGGKLLRVQDDKLIALFENGDPINCAINIQIDKYEDINSFSGYQSAKIVISTVDNDSIPDIFNSMEYINSQNLCQSAWQGQILITPQALAKCDVPEDVELNDTGVHTLNSFRKLIHILELNHPNLKIAENSSYRTLKGYSHNLPPQTTPFIGREYEISTITALLKNPVYHLITLIGPGGIGKTRLAIQVAERQTKNFPDGTFYISMNSRTKTELFYPELANILSFRFSSQESPEEQIYNYLRGKQMLIIIDNFENLIQGSIVLIDLIQNFPKLKIIVTSRGRLNLNMEWIQEVQGLPYPVSGENDIDQYSACKLFIQSARRVYPDFNPEYEQKKCIAQICQAVEGSPLGIELAASWVRSLSCCEIAEKVKNNLDFLSAKFHDLPSRHRSLRAVFEHSWSLLSEEERSLLLKLSIFRGGFDLKAADQIAKASIQTLTNCVDKSMLKYNPDGRYEMLETIRFFADERLTETSDKKKAIIHEYCTYYGSLMEDYEVDLLGHEQLKTLNALRMEIENIYNTWILSINTHKYDVVDKCINTIFRYHEIRCLYRNGREYFQSALNFLVEDTDIQIDQLIIKLRSRLGWFLFRLGHQTDGLKLLMENLQEVRNRNLLYEKLFLLNHLGEAYRMLGEFEQAMNCITESISDIESENIEMDDNIKFAHAQALLQFGVLQYSHGYLDKARDILLQCIDTLENMGNTWWVAKAYNALGVVVSKMEDHEQAKLLRQKCLEIFKEIDDKRGAAIALNNLAEDIQALGEDENIIEILSESLQISKEIGDRRLASIVMINIAQAYLNNNEDFTKAEQCYRESIITFKEIDDKRGSAYALYNYAYMLHDAGKLTEARKGYRESLELALSINDPSLLLRVLSGIARLCNTLGKNEKSAELCGYLLHHPHIEETIMTRTNLLVEKLKTSLTENELVKATEKGKSSQINDLINLEQI